MSPVTGQIDNRYSVIRMLGEGFTGEVYLVESSEGRFALKLLKPFSDRRLEESIIRAFKFEFGFLKDLRHPNVVRIQDFGFDDTLRRFYFTEEYLDGKPLNDFCKGASPELIGNLFIQSIEGLQAIHRAHILHGDLKGSNLLVIEEEGGPVIKIIDLGLSDPRFPFTAGTPSTMAPEKILKDHVDERSDLYSLGVVFYQIFTGSNPFIGKNVKETYQAHLALRPPKITLKNPQVPSYWNEIFDCLLEKNPAHRYRDAGALLEAIDFAKPQKAGKKKVKPWRPERWVGREKIVEEVSGKLKAFFEKKNGPAKVLLLLGEKGVGKSRIVQEVKYLFQMEKVEVFESKPGSLFPPSSEEPLLWVVDEGSRFSPEERSQILIKMEKNSPSWAALLSLLPEEGEDLLSDFEKKGVEVSSVTVRPFTREDLNEFLKELTDVKEVPDPFLDGLWEKTHGNPRLVIGLLEHLVADKRLVDARGHWNLSIFKEGGFDLRPLPLDLSEIDQALVILPAGDHKNRTELWIKRSEELLKKNLIDEASESLKKAEEETQKVQDLSQKLHFRSRIYEKEGWKLIREGHFDEAHNRMERALALLEESTVMDEVLEIRLHNFVAWLYCQEGKFDEAITLFEEQQRRAEKLPPAEQQRVLNNELGQAYLMKGDLKRAIFFLEAAFDFYEKVGDLPSRMKGLYNLAEAHAQAKDYSRAIQYYLKAAEMSRFHRNFELLLRAYNGLGKTFHLQGNYNEGLSYYERALELARYLEDYLSAAAIAQNIGSIQSERGDFEPADAHFELSLKMLRKLSQLNAHAKYLICRALLEKGDLYRKQKKFKDAEELIRDAFQLTQQESSLASFRFWVLYTQSQLERDQGNFEKLKDLMAELMPLADDGEKRDRCRELLQDKTMTPVVAPAEIHRTRAEAIPASPSRSGALEALIRVARWLASEKDPERLLPLIIRQATELSGAEAGVVLLEDAGGKMVPRASVNLSLNETLAQMSQKMAAQVLATGEVLQTGNAQQDDRFRIYESVVDLGLQSILALPIRSENRVMGVLSLVHRHRMNAFQDVSLELMLAFADQAGIALENARLVKSLEEAQGRLSRDLQQTQEELDEVRRNISGAEVLKRFIGEKLISGNKAMGELFSVVERLRDTDLSVLLHGESGTGKELIARSLHRKSRRAAKPFVAVNCAALPANLIESELFGYRAGAFTGATRDKKGLIEAAHEGTLFLDEIAELELPLQAKLLRVLEEREVTRLGDVKPVAVDFRLISASHRNLKEEIVLQKFREDLFYRICEIELKIPPLRERKEDIPLLAQAFIDEYLGKEGGRKEKKEEEEVRLGRDLLKLLIDYSWPGNVRELENVIRVATALRKGSILHTEDVPESVRASWGDAKKKASAISPRPEPLATFSPNASPSTLFDPKKSWQEMETVALAKSLLHFGFDVKKASEALGCAVSKLYQRMREYGLEKRKDEFQTHPFIYSPEASLETLKRQVFAEALKYCENSPYQAARLLKVSPGMVYQWMRS